MSHDPVAERVALMIHAHRERERRDPLADWLPMSWAQERILREIARGELFARFGNNAGKTNVWSRLWTAWMRGERVLGGIEIPPIATPSHHVLVVPSYKQSLLSSVAAMREAIGEWPHHEVPVPGTEYVSSFYVRPRRSVSDDWRTWSQMLVMPHEGELPEGYRLDGAVADEPPPSWWAHVIRQRRKAGRPFYRGIFATPKARRQWQWLKEDYERVHNGLYNEWVGRRMELVCPMRDNRALSDDDKAAIEDDARGNEYEMAILEGQYVNVEGSNPFRPDWLARWRSRIRPPQVERTTIEREVETPEGVKLVRVPIEVERWGNVEPDEVYLVVLDTGKGLGGGKTGRPLKWDPDCAHVYARRKRRLVARVNAYVGGYGIGMVGAFLARAFNDALVDPLVTGGYGGSVLTGLRVAGYQNILHHLPEERPGQAQVRLGTTETPQTAAEWFGAAEVAMREDTILIESESVIECLEDLVRDERGRIIAGPTTGHKDDWSCFGRACYSLGRVVPDRLRPRPEQRRPTHSDRMRAIRGSSRSTRPRPNLL